MPDGTTGAPVREVASRRAAGTTDPDSSSSGATKASPAPPAAGARHRERGDGTRPRGHGIAGRLCRRRDELLERRSPHSGGAARCAPPPRAVPGGTPPRHRFVPASADRSFDDFSTAPASPAATVEPAPEFGVDRRTADEPAREGARRLALPARDRDPRSVGPPRARARGPRRSPCLGGASGARPHLEQRHRELRHRELRHVELRQHGSNGSNGDGRTSDGGARDGAWSDPGGARDGGTALDGGQGGELRRLAHPAGAGAVGGRGVPPAPSGWRTGCHPGRPGGRPHPGHGAGRRRTGPRARADAGRTARRARRPLRTAGPGGAARRARAKPGRCGPRPSGPGPRGERQRARHDVPGAASRAPGSVDHTRLSGRRAFDIDGLGRVPWDPRARPCPPRGGRATPAPSWPTCWPRRWTSSAVPVRTRRPGRRPPLATPDGSAAEPGLAPAGGVVARVTRVNARAARGDHSAAPGVAA